MANNNKIIKEDNFRLLWKLTESDFSLLKPMIVLANMVLARSRSPPQIPQKDKRLIKFLCEGNVEKLLHQIAKKEEDVKILQNQLYKILSTKNINELQKAVIKTGNDVPVLHGNIAEVKIGDKAPKMGVASTMTEPAVLITITKQPNTSTLELTEKLDVALAELKKSLPADVNMTTDIYRQIERAQV